MRRSISFTIAPGALIEEEHVHAVALLADLVRESLLAPALHLDHLAAEILDPLADAVDLLVVFPSSIPGSRMNVVSYLVTILNLLRAPVRLYRFIAAAEPVSSQHSTASAARVIIVLRPIGFILTERLQHVLA